MTIKGTKLSEEHKRKLSLYFTGRKNPKISESLKGRKLSEETRKKISEAALKDSQNRSNRMKQVKPWKYRWNI